MNTFTVRSVLKSAYFSIRNNKRFFAIMAVALIIVKFGASMLQQHVLSHSLLLLFFFSFVLALIMAKYTIMIHRSILMNEYGFGALADWSSREITFIVMGVIVGLICFVLTVFFGTMITILFSAVLPKVSYVIGMVMLIAGGILVSRLSLIFPSIAIDDDIYFPDAWDCSRGNVIKLFILIIGFPVLVMGGLIAIAFLLKEYPWVNALLDYMNSLIWIYQVTILTHSYQYLRVCQSDSIEQVGHQV